MSFQKFRSEHSEGGFTTRAQPAGPDSRIDRHDGDGAGTRPGRSFGFS